MIPTTNVLTMPMRRRDDTPPADTHRSTPAFERVVQPPSPLDEPFADSIISMEREARQQQHARRQLDERARRQFEKALEVNKIHRGELIEARRKGFNDGQARGFREGWFWGICIGIVIGGSLLAAAVKGGAWIVTKLP